MIESQSEPAAFYFFMEHNFYLKNKGQTGYLDFGKPDIFSKIKKISPSLQGKQIIFLANDKS